MTDPPTLATDTALRKMFEQERILARLDAHTLREKVISSGPAPAHIGPSGTKSQLVRYVDANGETVAEAHQYVLPDGSIGASGMPDPKFVRRADGSRYYKP